MRPIKFYLTENLMDVKPKDLLEYMFDPTSNPRNMTIQALHVIRKMTSAKEFFFHNPFKYIKEMFLKDEYYAKAFKDFLTMTLKVFKNLKVNMISDFTCKGNIWDNMASWYRTKSDPNFQFLEDPEEWAQSKEELDFLTRMSLNGNPDGIKMNENEFSIGLADKPIIRAKRLTMISGGKWVNTSVMNYARVEYRRFKDSNKIENKVWFNFNTMIRVMERKGKSEIYITSTSDINNSPSSAALRSIFFRYLREAEMLGFTPADMRKGDSSATYDEEWGYWIKYRELKFKTIFIQNAVNWNIHLLISTKEEITLKNWINDSESAAFRILVDNYTIDTEAVKTLSILDGSYDGDTIRLADLMREPPDILTLNNIFKENKWLADITITESGASVAFDYMNMDDVMASFGFSGVEQTISTTLGALGALQHVEDVEDPEEEDEDIAFSMKLEKEKTSELIDISEALTKAGKFDDTESTSSLEEQTYIEKASLIKIMDEMISKSLRMELTIKRDEMLRYLRYLRKHGKVMTSFHNILFNQIREAFDSNLEDSMLVILYSIVLRSNVATINLAPTKSLKKIWDMSGASEMKFVEKAWETSETYNRLSMMYE